MYSVMEIFLLHMNERCFVSQLYTLRAVPYNRKTALAFLKFNQIDVVNAYFTSISDTYNPSLKTIN